MLDRTDRTDGTDGTGSTDLVGEGAVLTAAGFESRLQSHLRVHPPTGLKKAAPTLAFERLRDVEIPWSEVFKYVHTESAAAPTLPIRDYFERSWNLQPGAGTFDAQALADRVIELPDKTPWFTVTFASKPPDNSVIATAQQIAAKGLALRDGYGRTFLCKPMPGVELTKAAFATAEQYEDFWTRQLREIEQCFASATDATAQCTQVQYVDLADKAILDAYDQLIAQSSFDADLQKELDTAGPGMIRQVVSSGLDVSDINRLQQTIVTVRMRKFLIQRRLERLVQAAAELGYVLVLTAITDIKFPDGKERKDLVPGQLYRLFRREYKWTTTVDRVECTARQIVRGAASFFGIESPEPRRWQEQQSHSATVVDVQLINVNQSALNNKVSELGKTHTVFVFAKTANGFFTQNHTSLREVMLRCERDEAFRCRCAVLIPVIDTALSGQQVVSGYNVFLHPFPGIAPVQLPKVALRESLSYRMSWQATELGEVVSSINLAPGETRTITVRRSYERETTTSQKQTTILDITESETTDIATELEKELSSDNTAGWNLSMSDSVNASAPVEGINVGVDASRSFGYNQTVKTLSKTISKSVKKASRAVNRNYMDEVSTDTRQTTKVASFDEYTSTIRNVNEGRTLNLLFYRLVNRYKSGLFLDDLELHVSPSVEIIAGSGLYDARVFALANLDGVLGELDCSRLPFVLDETDQLRYRRLLLQQVEALLDREYNVPASQADMVRASAGDSPDGEADTAMVSAAVLSMPPPPPRLAALPVDDDAEEKARRAVADAQERSKAAVEKARTQALEATRANYENVRRVAANRFDRIALLGRCIEKHDVQLLAPGLYVDAVVGAVPSTELYAERMREQVIGMKMAEIELTRADARYRSAMAGRMASGGNGLSGVMPGKDLRSLALGVRYPLYSGNWGLLVDGRERATVAPAQLAGNVLSFQWDDEQKWLGEDDLLEGRLQLMNHDDGLIVGQSPVRRN